MLKQLEKYGFSSIRVGLLLVFLLIFIMIVIAAFMLHKQNEPVNYYMAENNNNYLILPTATPILQVDRVKEWATGAIVSVFNFNFLNINNVVAQSKQYFTENGWNSFQTELQNKGILQDITNKNLIFTASVCSLPLLANREQNPKAFYLSSKWKFVIPIIINIQAASGVTTNSVYMVDVVVRFMTDSEISEEQGESAMNSILGIDSINMRNANFTSYCKIPN